jgi:hypothetical protein
LAQVVAEVLERLGGPVDARAVEGKAQKHALLGGADRTLGLINLQLEVLLEKASETGFDALARPLAFDDDEKVVTVAGEEMPTPV